MIVRLLLSACLCLITRQLYCQRKTLNTRIDTAAHVTVNGGVTEILKADSVFIGTVVTDPSISTDIRFMRTEASLDSNNIFTIYYVFAPITKNAAGTFSVNIRIEFDKPFIPWYLTTPVPPNTIMIGRNRDVFREAGLNGNLAFIPQTSETWSSDYKTIAVRGLVVGGDSFIIMIRSKTSLSYKIYGALPQN